MQFNLHSQWVLIFREAFQESSYDIPSAVPCLGLFLPFDLPSVVSTQFREQTRLGVVRSLTSPKISPLSLQNNSCYLKEIVNLVFVFVLPLPKLQRGENLFLVCPLSLPLPPFEGVGEKAEFNPFDVAATLPLSFSWTILHLLGQSSLCSPPPLSYSVRVVRFQCLYSRRVVEERKTRLYAPNSVMFSMHPSLDLL